MINRKIMAFLLTVLMIVGSNSNGSPSFATAGFNGSEQIKVIVGFKTGIVTSQFTKATKIENTGGKVRHSLKLINAVGATMSVAEANLLSMDATVAYVERDYPVYSLEQFIPWGVEKSFGGEAYPFPIWDSASGAGIRVAVLDTGINGNHEDLSLSTGGVNCTVVGSYNNDVKGHGTHVAGTIAAQDNGFGVAGVAPQIILHSVKVLDDSGEGNVSDVIEGLQWAVDNNMRIVNMSLGTKENSTSLEEACNAAKNAGILLIAAAGNENISDTISGNVIYPAKYDSVMAVSALNESNGIADFSSTGPEVDIIAPGVNIISTLPGRGGNISMGGISYLSSVLIGSTVGAVDGQMIDCGTGLTEESVRNAISNGGIGEGQPWIALMDRDAQATSAASFSLKVRNAMTYGAVGVVIVNNDASNEKDPGAFTLYETTSDQAVNWVPTLSISTNSGVSIRNDLRTEGFSKQGELVVKENAAYGYNSGTSMAAPHVAGVAALLWSANPTLSNNEIRELISDTAIQLNLSLDTRLNKNYQGAGLVRGDLALTALYTNYPLVEAKVLTLAGFAAPSKVYDGTKNAVIGAGFSDNRDVGDQLAFSFNANFDTKDAGNNKAVSFDSIRISGGIDRYKYKLNQTTGASVSNISKAALSVQANNKIKTIGEADPAYTATYSGFILEEGEADLIGLLAFTRQAGEALGNYRITPSGLTSTNYAITFISGLLTIKANEVIPPNPPGGGGGGVALPMEEMIPVVTTSAITGSQISIRFNIGRNNLYQANGGGMETAMVMDVAPILYEDRTMLPIRFLVEPLGGTIAWNQLAQKVTILKGSTTIELWIGSNTAKINGVSTFIDVQNANMKPIIIAPGRTMLPIRFVTEALGCTVNWDQKKQEITVKY